MPDLVTSIARTVASKIVGGIVGWSLAAHVVVPAELSAAATLALTGAVIILVQIVYYVAARVLEQRWPLVGKVLLLSSRQPTYDPPRPQVFDLR